MARVLRVSNVVEGQQRACASKYLEVQEAAVLVEYVSRVECGDNIRNCGSLDPLMALHELVVEKAQVLASDGTARIHSFVNCPFNP